MDFLRGRTHFSSQFVCVGGIHIWLILGFEAVQMRLCGRGRGGHPLKFVPPCDGFVGVGEACYMKSYRERLIFKPLAFIT